MSNEKEHPLTPRTPEQIISNVHNLTFKVIDDTEDNFIQTTKALKRLEQQVNLITQLIIHVTTHSKHEIHLEILRGLLTLKKGIRRLDESVFEKHLRLIAERILLESDFEDLTNKLALHNLPDTNE